MPEINSATEKATVVNDEAIDRYVDHSLDRISKIISILVEAEEAYAMSRACKAENLPTGEDWRKNRDGWRIQGTSLLNEAWNLFSKQQGN